MKKYELKKIDVRSVAKLYLVLGLVLGLIFGFFTMFFLTVSGEMVFFVALIGTFFLSLFYALIGAGSMALMTWVYNLLADKFGGIKVYLTETTNLDQPAVGPKPEEPTLN